MSVRWSRLVAALVMMTAVWLAGSTSASGAPAQDQRGVGGSVGSQPVGAYDVVRPEVVPVVGGDTAGPVAATAHMAAVHVYDGPVASLAGANVSIPAENPFHQVTAGGVRAASLSIGVEGTSMTARVSLVTPRGLADDTALVRGGTNTPDRFAGGSGVRADSAGRLDGVSVNSGRTVEEAARGIPNNQVGVSTVGDVRAAGGTVRLDPTPKNPRHCLVGGLTAQQMSDLFTPTIKNPCK